MRRLLYIGFLLPLLWSCGGGDDNGLRLGDHIVGTWQRGWNQGDVIIEGETELEPENFSYDKFIFNGDGTYNGMLRTGTFASLDKYGDTIYVGDYKCDNANLKMEFRNLDGVSQQIHARVVAFTETTMQISYTNEEYDVNVQMILRKEQ